MTKTSHAMAFALLCLVTRLAAGVEVVSIPSQDGKLQLPGYWFKTDSAEPRPAIITLHGCGGALDDKGILNKNLRRDAGHFNAEKMHMLALDSFTPRGEKSICETPPARRRIHDKDRRDDVFAAIQWLAQQPGVDKKRIAVIGRSHGGQTALSVLDRTDKAVQAQPIQPKAVIALYPGCISYTKMWNYELSAPLLLMIGASDDWTPAKACVQLQQKVKRAQKDASFELHIFPDSYHGFDGTAPVRIRTNIGSTRSGTATVGGNPEAREKAHRRTFDFLSEQFGEPLLLTHEERLRGHRYLMPAASNFARIDDIAAVPLDEKGRARYEHFLSLPAPKAFAITEKKGWHFAADDRDAMQASLAACEKAKVKCWLYAANDRVVWQRDEAARIDMKRLSGGSIDLQGEKIPGTNSGSKNANTDGVE